LPRLLVHSALPEPRFMPTAIHTYLDIFQLKSIKLPSPRSSKYPLTVDIVSKFSLNVVIAIKLHLVKIEFTKPVLRKVGLMLRVHATRSCFTSLHLVVTTAACFIQHYQQQKWASTLEL
jgi:hypothetical protein